MGFYAPVSPFVAPPPMRANPSGAQVACCEPCQGLGYCRPKRNCCLECHFGYEESLAAQFFPPHLRERLHREHLWLEAKGFPEDAVKQHAEWEEAMFRRFFPAEVCDLLEHDHDEHGHGNLVSRVQFPSRRGSAMFSPIWQIAALR